MQQIEALETDLVRQLASRGLARAPGPLAFVHKGNVVRVTIKESLYRGLFIAVHETPYGTRQFRARDAAYDWSSIAASIAEIAERQRPGQVLSRQRPPGGVVGAGLWIQPSRASPGRVRVNLSELELDPMSAMQLYALVQHALPDARREITKGDAVLF